MSQASNNDKLFVPLREHDRIQGIATAPVILIEYGDYQCPRSGEACRIIKAVQQQLKEQLCFVFRHFPQTQIHKQAQWAAEAAEAAAAQGQFWQMHDMLFEHQQALDNGFLVEYANNLGLDVNRFLRALSAHSYANRVKEDVESGQLCGVSSTPTLFINDVRYKDDWVLEQYGSVKAKRLISDVEFGSFDLLSSTSVF